MTVFCELSRFTVTSFSIADGVITICADGQIDHAGFDPQDDDTEFVTATFEVEISDLDEDDHLPASAAEAALLVPPCAEWSVDTDWF